MWYVTMGIAWSNGTWDRYKVKLNGIIDEASVEDNARLQIKHDLDITSRLSSKQARNNLINHPVNKDVEPFDSFNLPVESFLLESVLVNDPKDAPW